MDAAPSLRRNSAYKKQNEQRAVFMRYKSIMALVATLPVLAACGQTLGEQATLGGAAGVGAAYVTKGDVLTGAVAGAAANVLYCQLQPEKC